jgi:murein DD-endopeptidase MepM/ murein hydrolase activator NlpD
MRRWFALVAMSLASCAAEEARPPVMPVVHMPWVPRRMSPPPKAPPPTSQEAVEPAPSSSAEPSSSIDIPIPEALGPLSKPLRFASLHSPMPGGIFAGYAGDTGLDLVGSPRPVHAIADAKVDYAEKGHTRWVGPKDSPYCVRLTLDQPIAWKGHKITHAYYAHLSGVAFEQREGADKRHVRAGEVLGTSGVARGVPHLHLGLLLDNEVEQDDWTFILREGDVRAALGGYANGETLPKM